MKYIFKVLLFKKNTYIYILYRLRRKKERNPFMMITLSISVASPFTHDAYQMHHLFFPIRDTFKCKGTDVLQFTNLIEHHQIEKHSWKKRKT